MNNCDIIDLPGFGTDVESDDTITFKNSQQADIILYLSQANGFMCQEDIEYLKANIKSLPIYERRGENDLKPLDNFFVIASQAHTVNYGNVAELTKILKAGCESLANSLPPHYWASRQDVSSYNENDYQAKLPSRFFTYTMDIPALCRNFQDEFQRVLETLPVVIDERAKAAVREYVSAREPNLSAEIIKYEEISKEREKFVALLRDIESNETDRRVKNENSRQDVHRVIDNQEHESILRFNDYCWKMVDVEKIVELLKEKKIKNNKKQIEQFSSQFLGMIQQEVETILTEKSAKLSETVSDYIQDFTLSIEPSYANQSLKVDFDAGWAFASKLSTAGLVGGLTGGVAGVAAIALLPFSALMGAAGTAAMVGVALGPVGIAAGLLVAGALGISKLFGGGWEKKVAKNLMESFEKNDIQAKYQEAIENYWREAKKAFDDSANELEVKWNAHVEELRKAVNEYDVDELEQKLFSLRRIKDFFEHIPV